MSAILALAAVGSLEAGLRAAGYVPSVTDDVGLWCDARSKLRPEDPRQVVLLGASRIQLGIDTDVLASAFGGLSPAQLAVDGSSCIPTLNHLSRDEHFKGIIICSVIPGVFFSGISSTAGKQAEFIQIYEQQSACAPIEQTLRIWMQSHLVIRLPEVSVGHLLDSIRHLQLPRRSYCVVSPDRCSRADYAGVDITSHRLRREMVVREMRAGAPAGEYEQGLADLKEMVSRIQIRGGQVCFVRMPASGGVRTVEDERFPRTEYWDKLTSGTGAFTINFADYPELEFECPDGSHMDYRDARRFTVAFAEILKHKLSGGDEHP